MGCDLAVQSEWASQRACKVVGEAGLTPLLIRNWRCPEIKCLAQGHMLFGGRARTRPVTQSLVPLHHHRALCPRSPLWTILSRWERRLSPQWELGKASKFLENTETTLPSLPGPGVCIWRAHWGVHAPPELHLSPQRRGNPGT